MALSILCPLLRLFASRSALCGDMTIIAHNYLKIQCAMHHRLRKSTLSQHTVAEVKSVGAWRPYSWMFVSARSLSARDAWDFSLTYCAFNKFIYTHYTLTARWRPYIFSIHTHIAAGALDAAWICVWLMIYARCKFLKEKREDTRALKYTGNIKNVSCALSCTRIMWRQTRKYFNPCAELQLFMRNETHEFCAWTLD